MTSNVFVSVFYRLTACNIRLPALGARHAIRRRITMSIWSGVMLH